MFKSSDKKEKEIFNMVMVCCGQKGQTIDKIQKWFSQDVCVFGGCSTLNNNILIKVKNIFSFCTTCYINTSNDQTDPQSINSLLEQIIQIRQRNCFYCETDLQIPLYKDYNQISAFNWSLCVSCFKKHREYTYDKALNKLKEFTPQLVKLSNQECCEPQCRQKSIVTKKNHLLSLQTEIHFTLAIWKDGKRYCGGCLYNKYEKIRKQFQKRNLSDKQDAPSPLKWDINEFYAQKQAFENHFKDRCMVCSKEEGGIMKFNKVKKGTGKDKNKLQCVYCNECYEYMQTNGKKYKQLLKIKQQIYERDSYEANKQPIIKAQYPFEKNMFGCIPNIFSINKDKGYCTIKQKNPQTSNDQRYTSKPIKSYGINGKRAIHEEFPQSEKGQDNQMTIIPQHEGDTQQYYPVNQQIDEQFEDVENHEEMNHTQRQNVQTARIRTPHKQEQFYPGKQPMKQPSDDMFEWGELNDFETIEQMSQRRVQSKTSKGIEESEVNSPTYFAQKLLNSGFIKQFRNFKITSNTQKSVNATNQSMPFTNQKCKVFSCSSLTGIMSDKNPYHQSKTQTYNRQANQKKEELQKQNEEPLKLGLMCSECFVLYLLGLIKEEQIPKEQWDRAMKENQEIKDKLDKYAGKVQ